MSANTLRAFTRYSLLLAICAVFLGGCGSGTLNGNGNGVAGSDIEPAGNNPDTLFAEVSDPEFGNYQLVARTADEKTGTWNFAVRPTRAVDKNELRFVWDFGAGPAGEGLEQTFRFTASGSYLITVTALKSDNSVAFVLKLTVEVVVDDNQPPIAVAGPDRVADENELVFLYGGDSRDPDNDEITYSWTQTFGPAVQILHAAEATASFVAPLVASDTDLVFRLTVSDGDKTGFDDVAVRVKKVADPAGTTLTVDAGPDKQANPGDTVQLAASTSPASLAVAFEWSQFQGPSVPLSNASRSAASFVAPSVAPGTSVVLGFEVIATLNGVSAADEVMVTVNGSGTTPGGDNGTGSTDPCLVDADGDGTPDCQDLCPADPRKGAPGICGCGVPETDTDGDATPDCIDGCPNDSEKVAPGLCGCGVPESANCGASGNCVNSLSTWRNVSFASQTGPFVAYFEALASTNNIDAIVGLSRGAGTTFSSYAALIRFNPAGTIDVRNGGSYAAATAFPYSANERIRFRVVVDVVSKRYDVYATRPGGVETTLASGYAFRTEQNTVTSLDNWGAWADTGTTLMVCAFSLSAPPLSANAGSNVTITTGQSTVLSGSASGGTPPYTYRWSPSTGLSNVSVANPTATPTVTTTYSLAVTDAANVTATSLVTVTVQAVALVADAGPDRTITAGSSTTLTGSATGGTPPYTYRWTPTTGLSNANVASPTATPSATTTYTLTVTDSASQSATDTAVVTVTTATAGTTYYVATNGNDANPGTEAQPWRTLTKAGNTARAGDTVYVKAGTYNETLRPVNSGTAASLITFKAYPGDECQGAYGMPKTAGSCKVIIDGQNSRSSGVDLTRPAHYIRIEGLDIRNHINDGVFIQGWYDCTNTGVEIQNNFIHHNGGDGVDGRNGISTVIENNEIYANGLSGITFGGRCGAVNFTARANNIHYNSKDGIQGSGRGCVFDRNRIYDQFHTDMHQDAFDITTLVDSVISNNTCFDLTQLIYGGPEDGSSDQLWDNVHIYGNILYTDRYYTTRGGEAPGIFIATGRNSTSPVRNIYIHSNTFAWLGYPGIRIYGGSAMGRGPVSNIRIRNNLFVDASIDVSVGSTSTVTSDYNYFLSTVGNQTNTSGFVAEGPNSQRFTNVSESLWFVNYRRHQSWDLRLAPSSPAIDAGDPNLGTVITLPSPFNDMWGQGRPTDLPGVGRDGGGAFDVGAHERP